MTPPISTLITYLTAHSSRRGVSVWFCHLPYLCHLSYLFPCILRWSVAVTLLELYWFFFGSDHCPIDDFQCYRSDILNSVLVLLIRQGEKLIPGLPAGFQYPCPTIDILFSIKRCRSDKFLRQEHLHISVPCPSIVSTVAFYSREQRIATLTARGATWHINLHSLWNLFLRQRFEGKRLGSLDRRCWNPEWPDASMTK
jgi:hypothetical protein